MKKLQLGSRTSHLISTLLSILVLLAIIPFGYGSDNFNVDGEHGELQVHGWLLEGACQLDMVSVSQEVELQSISKSVLLKPGNSGQPVPFSLRLLNCLPVGGTQTDLTTGNIIREKYQPVATVSFLAKTDNDNPRLIAITGVTGFGLMLKNEVGRQIDIGSQDKPVFVEPTNDQLNYFVVPVRTSLPLTTGNFRAVVNFQVSYD